MKAPTTQKDVCLLHREVRVVPFQSISRDPPEPNTMSRSTKRLSAELRHLPGVPILEDPTIRRENSDNRPFVKFLLPQRARRRMGMLLVF
jgi:hypothetical protein